MKKYLIMIAAFIALVFTAACGTAPAAQPESEAVPETPQPVYKNEYDPETQHVSVKIEDIEDLCLQAERLPKLADIEISDTVSSADALDMLSEAYPEAKLSYRVDVCGAEVSSSETELDLTGLSHEDTAAAVSALELLPEVQLIRLSGETMSLEDAGAFQALPSSPVVDLPFEFYDRQFNTADEMLVLSGIRMSDEGAAVRELLPYMTNCTQLEMEDCRVSNESMADIRDSFPDIKVVWRINFSCYSVRTDETRILASIKGQCMTYADVEPLKYCTDVKYLDLGHNCIEDISFVEYMPELEVCILAINYWSDASPLAKCEKLEYLEIFNTQCTDLTPLAGLKNLKHLNVVWLKNLTDITPLYELTGLERLWIGDVNQVPQEQLEEIVERLPNTVVNITTSNPTSEGWRKDPRYDLLTEQMGYNLSRPYSTR